MSRRHIFPLALVLAALSGCAESSREAAADNVEVRAEEMAGNLEEAAETAPNQAVEADLENEADLVRDLGDNRADAVRNGAAAEQNTAQ